MIQLRSYQIEAVQSLYNYFEKKQGNPVVAMPTATGKSVVIASFLESIFRKWPDQKIMVLTHVKELILQNYKELLEYWPFAPAGIYSAGLKQRDVHSPIIFGGIASVAKRAVEFGFVNLILIDEAHLLSPNDKSMYQAFIAKLKARNPKLKVIGFTATPYRLGHGHIADGQLFDDVCFNICGIDAFARLIAEGFLSPLIPKNTKIALDVSNVQKQGGEFVQNQLQIAVDREEITYAALKEALETAHDRKHWLIFSSGVDHAMHIRSMLQSLGETCEAVHSKMSTAERDKNIEDFKTGKIRMLVNNNILTTGFNAPWVDCIVCLRPTASSVLWVQMLGRGTRPFNGNAIDPRVKENCLALDFAGNTRRLGPINDPVVPRKKGEGGGEAPVKLCETCNTWNHISARLCFVCGSKFTFAIKIQQNAGTLDLIAGPPPRVEVFKVDTITYRPYSKLGSPNSVKATYYCGLNAYSEWICFEHGGFPGKKARDWWRYRTNNLDYDVPTTCEEALKYLRRIPAPTHLRVWVNKKHPEILAQCFDGTAFNTQGPDETVPSVHVDEPPKRHTVDITEDEIPF
jgi:DNA repair protein RadD